MIATIVESLCDGSPSGNAFSLFVKVKNIDCSGV